MSAKTARPILVANVLANAQRAAGWRAVEAAEQGNRRLSEQWSDLAVRIGELMRESISLAAAPSRGESAE